MKTPEEIAEEIVNVASEAAYGDCPKRHMDATDEHCPGCLRSMIAAAIREAEDRATKAEKAFHALWSVSGDAIKAAKDPERNPWIGEEPWRAHVREMAEIERAGAKIAAAISEQRKRATFTDPIAFDVDAISAERDAGTVPPAPAPVRPPAVRVPTPEEIAAMPLEQVAAETARLKRETGAVGGISRCEPAPACARCGGAEVLPCPYLREECKRLGHEAKHAPCPECRGTP